LALDALEKDAQLLAFTVFLLALACIPAGTVSIPTGTVYIPAGTVFIPAGTISVPAGTVFIPAGTVSIPAGTVSIPAGTVFIPAGTISIPAGTDLILIAFTASSIRLMLDCRQSVSVLYESIVNVNGFKLKRIGFILEVLTVFLYCVIVSPNIIKGKEDFYEFD
jgi:protein phosphatase 1 regulatory subunit 37